MNERLTRVGRGTPGGDLMRRYWQPVLLTSELVENDGGPARVRLLGEDLIAFRDTSGTVGLVDSLCPHRCAPMFFARNEEHGLRCVYHGWKFNAAGDCVDIPSEPPGSAMKNHIRIGAYPTYEGGGIVWAYLGPREGMPAPPNYEWMRAPATHRHLSKTYEACNFLQAMEGGLDTTHSSFLHNNDLRNRNLLRARDTAPRLDVHESACGYTYVSTRKAGDGNRYVRVYQYIMPTQQLRGMTVNLDGMRADVPKSDGHLWVAIDDEQTWVYNLMYSLDRETLITREYADSVEKHAGRGADDLIPGTFRLKRNTDNDYLIDRQMQKTLNFTGIRGVNTQDFALQENMGKIVDRSREHLGTSDRAIVTMRRMMAEAIQVVEDGGQPRGVAPESHAGVRAYDKIVHGDVDWKEAFATELVVEW